MAASQVMLDDFSALQGVFDGVAQQASRTDYKPALKKIVKHLGYLHATYFRDEKSPLGAPWQPWFWRAFWAPNDHSTLHVTGRLMLSLIGRNRDHVENITDRELVWGTSVPYAGIHNLGAQFRTGIPLVSRTGGYLPAGSLINIPQREHVGLSAENVQPIAEIIADQAVATLKKK